MPEVRFDDITIAYDMRGDGPAVLMLHGFPQTRAMWTPIADALSRRFTVVTADLRGYGASSKPKAFADLSNYSFRAMADDQRKLMEHLGFPRFHLIGHDRGARTAYRLATDTPGQVETLTLMDIVPTRHLLDNWSAQVSKAYFHWSFLAQPAPFPEHMIEADPDHFYEACLLGWGGASLDEFPAIQAYRTAWRDPAMIAGSTNDYRAAVSVDYQLDTADPDIALDCPALVLYGTDGVMARLFDVPATWKDRLKHMTAKPMPGGHFFVDQNPRTVTRALDDFLP